MEHYNESIGRLADVLVVVLCPQFWNSVCTCRAHVGLNPKRNSVYAYVGLGIQSNFIVHRDVPVWTFAMCVLAKVHLCVWPVVVERNYN